MDREEIEKLLEESANNARKGRRRGPSREQVRNVLNALFLAGAAAGLILYFAVPGARATGLGVVGVAMLLKIAEFFLRFML